MHPSNLEKITRLRHELHLHPELSMQESGTMTLLQAFLRENTSLEICLRDGWFYALKKGQPDDGGSALRNGQSDDGPSGLRNGQPDDGPSGLRNGQPDDGPTGLRKGQSGTCHDGKGRIGNSMAPIAFRADMDALPIPETIALPYGSQNAGVSHKCGHDGHSAALCGLALELSGMETSRDVYLIFQPGEEIGAGALLCRDLIREKGIAEVYAFHNLGGYPEGALVYRRGLTQPASEGLRIRLTGKASHASAPEKGNNPAGLLAGIVQFAQGMASQNEKNHRENLNSAGSHDGIDAVAQEGHMRLCTVTGIRLGDGNFGISPGEGEICLTLRAQVEDEMKAMEQAVLTYAESAASDAGLRISWSIHDYFPETRNNDACLQRVLDAARGRKMPAIPMTEIWRASEDFGYYLKYCPGAMFYIGNGEQYPPLHTAEYDFNDRILERAVDLLAALI